MLMKPLYSLLLLGLMGAALCLDAGYAAPPNILFIFSDDHRHDLLGVQNPALHTPHLDALANSGVRFDTAIATTAICSPARAAVLTGRYGSQNGVTGLSASIHSTEVTFADYLKTAGYRTAQFGKWHLGNTPASVGFDEYARINSNGSWFNRGIDSNIPGMPGNLGGRFYEAFMADRVMDYVSNHVNRASTSTNAFAVWWCNQVPHLDGAYTYPASRPSLDLHDVAQMPVPGNWDDDLSGKPPHLPTSRYVTKSGEAAYGGPGGYTNMMPGMRNPYLGQDHVQQHNQEYYAAITDLDREIGRVLAALEDPNQDGDPSDSIATNTWVIFLGDNGWQTGSHKFTSKVLSYEESMRVPLIVRGPGIPPRVDTNLVLNIDLTPMMLDIAGVAIPADMHGMNLRTLLENPVAPWRDRIYYEAVSSDLGNQPHRTIRTHQYKFIQTHSLSPVFEELYDLSADPLERTNVVHETAYAGVVSNLVQALQEEQEAIAPAIPPGLPWSGLVNPGFEENPFDAGWVNPGLVVQADGITEGSIRAALVGGGGTGRFSQPIPGAGDFTLSFAIQPASIPSSDRMWNLVLHQGGGDGSTSGGAMLNIKGALDGSFQVYNGSGWVPLPGSDGAFAVGQTTRVRLQARDFNAGFAARYDVSWSLPDNTNLAHHLTGLSHFQGTPTTTGVTGLNFARTSGSYGRYLVDDVQFSVPVSRLIRNGDFEQGLFPGWWGGGQVELSANLAGSSPGQAARFPYNVPSELWQTLTPRRDFTFSTRFELAGTNHSSLHVHLHNDRFAATDQSAGEILALRVAPGGTLEVKAGNRWRRIVDRVQDLPASLLKEIPYELQIIGRDFGLPGASWDLAWMPLGQALQAGSATNLTVFANLAHATTGTGVTTARFTQIGIPPAHSFVVDDVLLTESAGTVPGATYRIEGIVSPGKGFLSWMASMGYDPTFGLHALATLIPGGDGIPALTKYTLGLPLNEAQDLESRIQLNPAARLFTVVMIATDPGLSLRTLTSEDLEHWILQPPSIEINPSPQDGVPPGLVRRQYQLPTPSGNRQFVQTQVQML